MTEQVLVIPSKLYIDNPTISVNDLKDIISKHGLFMDRPAAEIDTNYLQIIPYIVVRKAELIFCYQRLKKGNESRLHSKYSIGIGGHVNPEDNPLVDGLTLWSTVEIGAFRELSDELHFDQSKDCNMEWTHTIIYDPSNDVGKVHLGIVAICDLDSTLDVEVGEPEKIEGSFMHLAKIESMHDKLETWSQIVINDQLLWKN